MKNVFRLALTALFISAMIVGTASAQEADAQTPTEICDAATPATDPATREFTEAGQVLEAGVDYRAVFCTTAGAVYIDLLEGAAPITVNNFVFLSEQGYYNNTTFHRVIPDFMVQGGDPTATGSGGPGYQFQDEFAGYLTFDRPGWLAMANAGAGTNGSQFFITTVPTEHLNFRHTIFGEVLEGQETVTAIEVREPATATTPGTLLNTVVIVTDPATVETTYVSPEPATQEEVSAQVEGLRAQLPPTLLVDETTTGTFTAEQVVETAPETLRGEYADFLSTHNFEYRVSNRITNASCDGSSLPFWAIGYALDRFATSEDARAALSDGFLAQLAAENGFTAVESSSVTRTIYTQNRNVCEVDSIDAIMYRQQGHFIVTARATFPASTDVPVETWLSDRVDITTYQQIFADTLRRELR